MQYRNNHLFLSTTNHNQDPTEEILQCIIIMLIARCVDRVCCLGNVHIGYNEGEPHQSDITGCTDWHNQFILHVMTILIRVLSDTSLPTMQFLICFIRACNLARLGRVRIAHKIENPPLSFCSISSRNQGIYRQPAAFFAIF